MRNYYKIFESKVMRIKNIFNSHNFGYLPYNSGLKSIVFILPNGNLKATTKHFRRISCSYQ